MHRLYILLTDVISSDTAAATRFPDEGFDAGAVDFSGMAAEGFLGDPQRYIPPHSTI